MADNRPTNVGQAQRPSATSSMKAYAGKDAGVPPQYQVVLDVRGDQSLDSDKNKIFPIIAALPEHYNISLSSEWSSPYANLSITDAVAKKFSGSTVKGFSVENIVREGGNLLGQTSGVATRVKSQSLKVWDGSSSLRFSLELVFHAKTNAATDIRDKHIALLKLAAPSEWGPGGQLLMQPGPVIADLAMNSWNEKSRKISLQLGTYLYFDNVVIHSVGTDVETLCDANGTPIALTVNIEVETFYSAFTAQDIEKAFKGSGG